jgi:anti-sigma-K factor RskA
VIGDHPDRDDLVAYSLEALDPREAAAVEAHAPSCARCTRELQALAPAVAVLGESVEQLEPPPALRERVMAEVHGDVARAAEEPAATPPRRQRRGWRGLVTRPAMAVGVAIAVAAIGGYVLAGNGGGGGEGAQNVPVVAQQGIGGTLEIGEHSSMLDLHGLHQLSGREVYQVWVAQDSTVKPSSNFIPDTSGRAMTAVDGQLTSGTKVMVTREPHAGEPAPTTPVLLTATIE